MCRVIPYYDAKLPAGFPSPANDYLKESIDLNEIFIKHPLSTFMVSTEGDSMNGSFIPNNSLLLVDKSVTAKSGDIVVAQYNGEFTVKHIVFSNGSCFLVPANDKYATVKITEEMNMQVWGVVIMIFVKPQALKKNDRSRRL